MKAPRILAPAFVLLCGGVPAGYMILTGLRSPEPWFRWPCIVGGAILAVWIIILAVRAYKTAVQTPKR